MKESKFYAELMPPMASTTALVTDMLYWFMVVFSIVMTVAISLAIAYLAIRWRKREGSNYVPPPVETSHAVELTWTLIPLVVVIGMFIAGAELFFYQRRVPEGAMDIAVTGKQWMFKFQHPNGRREIGNLHVPVGKPVKLTLASEDVIHNVFIPAFRVKHDMVPGRYTHEWFEATKPGEYHIFCNQYCGTQHSEMIGKVIVMEQPDYQAWLTGFSTQPPAQAGEALFTKYACNTCHLAGDNQRGPSLAGLLGSEVELEGGHKVIADKSYIRESILNPQAKIVKGYQPIMPSFNGVATPEQVDQLIAYIETLKPTGKSATTKPADSSALKTSDAAPASAAPAAVVAVANPTAPTSAKEAR